jgi:hypothetical protein
MNETLANLTLLPLTLLRGASGAISTRFSYVHVPHIKLKAEHQALVLFHIVKIGLAYWEGWRDGKKTNGEDGNRKKDTRKKRKSKRQIRVLGKGKYTVVFQ